MSKSLTLLAAAALLVALGACNRQPAGGVTPDEERQLNEAREMLKERDRLNEVIDVPSDDLSANAEAVAEEEGPAALRAGRERVGGRGPQTGNRKGPERRRPGPSLFD